MRKEDGGLVFCVPCVDVQERKKEKGSVVFFSI